MTQILAVSKATKNVLTATDPNDFIFHSSYNTFKILTEGLTSSNTVNANPKTFTLAHGQGQIPTFFAFAKFPDGKIAMPDSDDFSEQFTVNNGYGSFSVEADATNLYFIFTRNSSNYSVDIKYYIFEVPL